MQTNKTHVIVEMDGGLVAHVYADDPNVTAHILHREVMEECDLKTKVGRKQYAAYQKLVRDLQSGRYHSVG